MTTLQPGDQHTFEVTFLDESSVAFDPDTVQVEIRFDDTTVAGPFDYPDDITRVSTGRYRYGHTVADDAEEGEWQARWAWGQAGQSGYAIETFTVDGVPSLITVDDVEARIGRDLTDAERSRVAALIRDASAAIRLYTGREFAAGSHTVRRMPHHGVVTLRAGVASVTSVENLDGAPVGYTWDGLNTIRVGSTVDTFSWNLPVITQAVDVTYTTVGDVPAAVAAVAAQMVARAFGQPADQSGVQQEAIAGYSYTVGTAAASGPVGLLPDERAILGRYRRRGGTIHTARV